MYGRVGMEHVRQTGHGPFLLTHAIWFNGYGACPETGIRCGDIFELCQHGSTDWDWIEGLIIRCLDKGKSAGETALFVMKLADRRYNRRSPC